MAPSISLSPVSSSFSIVMDAIVSKLYEQSENAFDNLLRWLWSDLPAFLMWRFNIWTVKFVMM